MKVSVRRLVLVMVKGMALVMLVAGCASKSDYDKAVADLASCRSQLAACQADERSKLDQADDLLVQEKRLRETFETQTKSQALEIERLRGRLMLRVLDRLLFDSGSVNILPEGRKILDQLLASLEDEQFDIMVEGHTDSVPIGARLRPKYASNWDLSCGRAVSVIGYLERTVGIAPTRMVAVCHSKYRPVADNNSAANRQQNRRVTIVLAPAGSMKHE